MSQSKKMKVRMARSFAKGYKTTTHYPQEFTMQHNAYTLPPKKIKVRFKYEWSPGLHTTFTHLQKIVKKHYIYEAPPKITIKNDQHGNQITITEMGPTILM